MRNGWTTDDPTAIWVAPRSIPIRRFRITSALARLGRQLVRVRPGQGGRWDPTCLLSDRRDEQQPRPDPGGHDRASSCGQRTNMTGPCRLFPARRHVSLGTEVNLNSRAPLAPCRAPYHTLGAPRQKVDGRRLSRRTSEAPTPWKAPPDPLEGAARRTQPEEPERRAVLAGRRPRDGCMGEKRKQSCGVQAEV